jgi:RNA polymerase sigma-70 factor, ECF subfamily
VKKYNKTFDISYNNLSTGGGHPAPINMLNEKRIIEIYSLYKNEIFVYILRFIHLPEQSEDILHDCFEHLIKYSLKYDLQDTNIRSFLYKTAHNLCINYLKRSKLITQVPLDEDSKLIGDSYITEAIELDQLNERIYALILEADPLSRSIFIMKKEQDMEMQEIARITGVSERTVRRKMSKLLETIAAGLKKEGLL